VQPWGADRAVLECLVGHDFDDAVELAWPERRRARAGYGTAGDHWGVAASSLVRAQGAVHAGDISTVATMTAEILRHSEAIWYDAFVVPAMLLEACVAERRNDPGAAEDAYRRALELAGASALPTTSPSPWSDSARTRSCARTRAKPRSSVGGRWPWPRRPRRRASPRMRACSSPGDADIAETLYGSVVEWSQTPRPRQVRELLFVVLAGSPGRRRCGAWRGWRQPAGTTTRPTTSSPEPPRWQRATAPRPTRYEKRLW
jgi:hypothetical protein